VTKHCPCHGYMYCRISLTMSRIGHLGRRLALGIHAALLPCLKAGRREVPSPLLPARPHDRLAAASDSLRLFWISFDTRR
jgi:non-ribosomal peptide synthetase component F